MQFLGLMGKAAAFAANKVVSDDRVLGEVQSILKERIEFAVAQMGITAVVTKRFQKGSHMFL